MFAQFARNATSKKRDDYCTGHNCIKFLEKQELSTNAPTHDTPYLPQKCFISIVFSILRDDSNTHKKNRSNGCAKCFFFCGRRRGRGGRRAFFSGTRGQVSAYLARFVCLGVNLAFTVKSSLIFPGISLASLSPRRRRGTTLSYGLSRGLMS